jgi:hypothetical protein
MNRLKTEHKDLYERISIGSVLREINERFPSPAMEGMSGLENVVRFEKKSVYALVTLRYEIEPNKMVCLARHLTWMYQDWSQDPIDRMRDHSVDFVIHQDLFLIERTQKFCAQIFKEILSWDKAQPVEELKNRVALLRFVYGNSMPCSRGDGAIGDWLELALYRHHGFKEVEHKKDQLPCFELLSTIKLSDYLKNYSRTITIK